MVEQVIIRPKRNTKVDTAQWQVITSMDDCNPESWKELKRGKMVTRPVPNQVFVTKINHTEIIHCLGVAFSDDHWLDKIIIMGKSERTGEVLNKAFIS